MVFQKIKNWEDKSLNVETRNSESWINIFRKWIEEAFNEEFKKIQNCDAEVLKFRKSSSQYKTKK